MARRSSRPPPIGARLRLFPIRAAVIAIGWAVFLGTVAWLATFPVSL